MDSNPAADETKPNDVERREFIGGATGWVMAGSLAASYGTFALYGGRYLYPSKARPTAWLYVARVADLSVGDAIAYETPAGARVTITRRGEGETANDFLALSSTCPHLGCKVFWEPQNDRFFCPCHNGVFASDGTPRSGPPADAKQSLLRFPLDVRGGLLYVRVATDELAAADPPSGGDQDRDLECGGKHRRDADTTGLA